MNSNVLVLNQNYQAIGVCSVERAFVLVYLDKAESVFNNPDKALRTVTQAYDYPSIIRLYRYVTIPYKKVSLSRQNIYKRDGSKCVYCDSGDSLTIDHVMPRSKGGRDSWQNLVTACLKCNTLKGDRTPEQAEMPLLRRPYRPSFIMYLRDFSGNMDERWNQFLYAS